VDGHSSGTPQPTLMVVMVMVLMVVLAAASIVGMLRDGLL
jgi:hypothetical protein